MRPRAAWVPLLALSAASLAVGVGLSIIGHVNAVVQIIPFALGFPGLCVGWLTYRTGSSAEFADMVNDLAGTVFDQWEKESRVRQVGDSDLLSVSWEPAADDLVGNWPHLLRTTPASPGVVRSVRSLIGRPSHMSGSDGSLVNVLKGVPTGRLVVLGEPGSGKTVLLIRLLLDLLREREPGAAVPVIMPLASWDPSKQGLREWLKSRLVLDYPSLKNPWKSSTESCTLAEALLKRHLLLIILDGLDEIPKDVRTTAISKINDFLTTGTGIVLSSRIDEYREALAASGVPGLPMKVRDAAGISLCSLSNNSIREYILGDADKGSAAAKRWEPVFRTLAMPTPTPVGEALRTPLNVTLARAVYDPPWLNERNLARVQPGPEEICDSDRFPDRAAIESHLFRAFIHIAYEPREDVKKDRWEAAKAERWLRFLAQHLQAREQDYNILAWWELQDSVSAWLVPAVVGIICGLASGLAAGSGAHVGFGIGIGLGAGALVALSAGTLIRLASDHKGKPSTGIAGALIGAIPGALLGALAGKLGIGHAVWPFGGFAVALAVAIGAGSSTNFPGGLASGLVGGFLATVLEGFGKGLPAGLMNGAGMGLAAALAAKYVGRKEPAYRLRWSPLGAVCGVAIGTAVGLITGRVEGPHAGLVTGVIIGLLSSLPCGLTYRIRRPADKSAVLSPGPGIAA